MYWLSIRFLVRLCLVCNCTHIQISAGRSHSAAWTAPPIPRSTPGTPAPLQLGLPDRIPTQYPALKDCSPASVRARLRLLHHFSDLMYSSWRLLNLDPAQVGKGTGFGVDYILNYIKLSNYGPGSGGEINKILVWGWYSTAREQLSNYSRIFQNILEYSRPKYSKIFQNILEYSHWKVVSSGTVVVSMRYG